MNSQLSDDYRASMMRARMQIIICSDGKRRNALGSIPVHEQIKNFWDRVSIKGKNECWMWRGAVCGSKRNYGAARWNGRLTKAHRIAYEITNGPIPKGLLGCHKCDNTLCVNPDHIFIGTQKDNLEDMRRKGRQPPPFALRGEDHPRSTLTERKVIMIKALKRQGKLQREIALATGVSMSALASVLQGRTWRHIQITKDSLSSTAGLRKSPTMK